VAQVIFGPPLIVSIWGILSFICDEDPDNLINSDGYPGVNAFKPRENHGHDVHRGVSG
jgi:hypothetical protein